MVISCRFPFSLDAIMQNYTAYYAFYELDFQRENMAFLKAMQPTGAQNKSLISNSATFLKSVNAIVKRPWKLIVYFCILICRLFNLCTSIGGHGILVLT